MAKSEGSSKNSRVLSQLIEKVGKVVPADYFSFKSTQNSQQKKIQEDESVDVAIFTEGTYPYVRGGVSTVIHQTIESHPNLTFGIIYIGWEETDTLVSKYAELPQVKWVKTLFLNNKNQSKNFSTLFYPIINESTYIKLAEELFQAISELKDKKSTKALEKIYFNYLNPLTKTIDLKKVLTSSTFLETMFKICDQKNMSLSDLYWLQKGLTHIFCNLTDHVYPKAKVYHSHTQGYAGFAASIASLQHQGGLFLTEHSLYLRDVQHYVNEEFNIRKEKFAKKKVEISGLELQKQVWHSWFHLLGQWTYKQVDATSYLYPRIAQDAFSYGSPESLSMIIPNGINYQDFESAREMQIERNKLRSNPDHVWTISLVGRIVPVKGIVDMIETTKLLKAMLKIPFKVELVGPTDEDLNYFKRCNDLIIKYELQDNISFLGPKKVTEYLGHTDLIVLSSHSEALPMATLEAMACKIPVVSTDVGSVRDIIINPINDNIYVTCGLVSPPQNPLSLAKSITKLLNNSELYNSFIEAAPLRVKAGYQLKNVMIKYGNTYKNLKSHTIQQNRTEILL